MKIENISRRSFMKKTTVLTVGVASSSLFSGLVFADPENDYYYASGKIAIKWQISTTAELKLTSGPQNSKEAAVASVRDQLKTQLLGTNVTSSSGMVDVSGLTEITRVYPSGSDTPITINGTGPDSAGKYTATITVPAGSIRTTFYE